MNNDHILMGAGAFKEIVQQNDELIGALFHLCAYSRLAPSVLSPENASGDIGVEGEWEDEGVIRKYTFTVSYNGKGTRGEYRTLIPFDAVKGVQHIEAVADDMFKELGLQGDYKKSVEELRERFLAARSSFNQLSTEERDEACSCPVCSLKVEMRNLLRDVRGTNIDHLPENIRDSLDAFLDIGDIVLGDEPASLKKVNELVGRVAGGDSRMVGIVPSDGVVADQMHPNAALQVMAFLAPMVGEMMKEAASIRPVVH